jgi:hypothetical protein
MSRTVVAAVLFGAIGVAVGALLVSRVESDRPAPLAAPARDFVAAAPATTIGPRKEPREAGKASDLERRVELLARRLAAEVSKRKRLEEHLDKLTAQIAALGNAKEESEERSASPQISAAPQAPAVAAESAAARAADPLPADSGTSAMERALITAGVDDATAAEIKRRHDELELTEIYLRNLAAREGWLNSPRFREEMAEIENQRISVRNEIGDDRYDRYLTALGQPNRVKIDEVLLDSPAALAGLQAGDLVLRYGDARIFAPGDLVDETHRGRPGEPIRLEIIRSGQRLLIEVARGPLGIRVGATRTDPDEG